MLNLKNDGQLLMIYVALISFFFISEETQTEQDVLIVQTNSGLKYVELKQRKITVEVSFQSYSAELRVKTKKDNIVTINTVNTRLVSIA